MRSPQLGLTLLVSLFAAQGCVGELGVGSSDLVERPDSNPSTSSSLIFEPSPDDWIAPLNKEILNAALLDVTGDALLDVVILTKDGVEVLKGDGRAGFALLVEEPAEPVDPVDPPVDPPDEDPAPPLVVRALLGADLDADGIDELVTCQSAEGALSVYAQGALFGASASTPARSFSCVMLVAGDLDGDGEQDIIELLDMGEGALGVSAWQLLNSGQLTPLLSADEPIQELGAISPTAALVRDFDGDGRAELLIAQQSTISSFSLVNGKLQRTVVLDGFKPIKVLNALDIDHDGDLDLHIGIQGDQDRLLLSDGKGRFADATWSMLPVEDSFSTSSVVVDLNADGFSDLIMGTSQGYDRLYIGDRGRLVDATPRLGFVDSKTLTMFAGDLDGDEDLDLISVGRDGQLRIFARQPATSSGPSKAKE